METGGPASFGGEAAASAATAFSAGGGGGGGRRGGICGGGTAAGGVGAAESGPAGGADGCGGAGSEPGAAGGADAGEDPGADAGPVDLGDQYLCLEQVKENGKVPPPPPQTVDAVPVAAVPPPPPPAATFVKVPAPPPGIQKDRDTERTETVTNKKSSRIETSVATAPETESEEKGGHPTLVRILIAVTNLIFLIVLCFWVLTLLSGLHIADVAFINNMFMG